MKIRKSELKIFIIQLLFSVQFGERIVRGSYNHMDMLDNITRPLKDRSYVNEGQGWDLAPQFGNKWLINLHVLCECGITLMVPESQKLFSSPINIKAMKEASKRDFYQECKILLKDPTALRKYLFSNVCDANLMLYFISKKA